MEPDQFSQASDGRVVIVNEWAFATPKTKDAVVALNALGIEGRVLIVLNGSNDADVHAARSFGNLQEVQLIEAGELNAYDVLVNDYIVFTTATLPGQTAAEKSEASA